MSKTTVVLADDHAIVRQGLRAVLEATSEFTVVGEVADGLQVPEVVDRLRPNVLVLDLMMPGLNGLEITRQVSKRCPQTRVVILSMHADEPYVLEALRNGATGYVLKEASTTEVAQAVREVAAGRRYLSQPLSERAIEAYAEKAQAAPLDLYETLTTREREILQLCAEGYSSTEMAARLGISPRTADTHRANIMRKLGLQGQTDLVRYALRRGILPL
ncbi:MAG: response regulator transcription factor [Dehalococcoidia bacterium]|jgi:DNA-binding NarL/FixJ family response regulator|nr:response regulator transcription factor [Dehalococcoidia bacterium]